MINHIELDYFLADGRQLRVITNPTLPNSYSVSVTKYYKDGTSDGYHAHWTESEVTQLVISILQTGKSPTIPT